MELETNLTFPHRARLLANMRQHAEQSRRESEQATSELARRYAATWAAHFERQVRALEAMGDRPVTHMPTRQELDNR